VFALKGHGVLVGPAVIARTWAILDQPLKFVRRNTIVRTSNAMTKESLNLISGNKILRKPNENIHKTLEELLQDAVCRTNEGVQLVQQQYSLGLFEEGKTSYRGIQINSDAVYPYSTALVLLRPNLVDELVWKIAYYFPQ
jgi:hypothetical protein